MTNQAQKYKRKDVEMAKVYFKEYQEMLSDMSSRLEESESWVQVEPVLLKIWHLAVSKDWHLNTPREIKRREIKMVDLPLYIMPRPQFFRLLTSI